MLGSVLSRMGISHGVGVAVAVEVAVGEDVAVAVGLSFTWTSTVRKVPKGTPASVRIRQFSFGPSRNRQVSVI